MLSFDYPKLISIVRTMISILGAGAIGQLIAHKLTDASVDCQFIVRDSVHFNETWSITENSHTKIQQIKTTKASDADFLEVVLVCVKAPQLEQALSSIQHRINDETHLILLQNGMGHEKIAQQFIQPKALFLGSNTHGAFLTAKQEVNYAGKGQIKIGTLSSLKYNTDWLDKLSKTNLDIVWEDNIYPILMTKLLTNACINPLAAIYQCTNGELLNENHKPRLLALIQENQNFAETIQLDLQQPLKEIVTTVLQATYNNRNSMLQDVEQERTTEINAINGYLLGKMEQINFKAPHNWKLWSDFHIQYPPLKNIAQKRAASFDTLQYEVTQNAGTERPYTGIYNAHYEQGHYLCVCCDSLLFDSQGKFDSHCGWPSFDRATNNKAIAYRQDLTHGMNRTETLCAQCGSHLGHVFDDGSTETSQRYCINSVSLTFKQ